MGMGDIPQMKRTESGRIHSKEGFSFIWGVGRRSWEEMLFELDLERQTGHPKAEEKGRVFQPRGKV